MSQVTNRRGFLKLVSYAVAVCGSMMLTPPAVSAAATRASTGASAREHPEGEGVAQKGSIRTDVEQWLLETGERHLDADLYAQLRRRSQ